MGFFLNTGVLAQSSCPHGWLKNDNSCYLFVTHVDNDWTESEVHELLMLCGFTTNNSYLEFVETLKRYYRKLTQIKSVSVFLPHAWIQTGRDWDRRREQLPEKPRSVWTPARYSRFNYMNVLSSNRWETNKRRFTVTVA